MFYGFIEIYIAFDKEPKVDDFQDSNLLHGESDYLRIVSFICCFYVPLAQQSYLDANL
jgi:hypothetical protein